MTAPSPSAAFAWRAAAVAGAAGLSTAMGYAAAGLSEYGWLAAGWLAAAIPGVAGGAWLAGRLGRPDAGFLIALGTSMGARAVAVAGGLIVALRWSAGAPAAFLLGFGATFVPVAVYEAFWFARRSVKSVGR